MTQPKPEEGKEPIAESSTKLEHAKTEVKPKLEAPAVQQVAAPAASTGSSSTAAGMEKGRRTEEEHVPVKHPHDVWLPKPNKDAARKQEPFILQLPNGSDIDIRKLRPVTKKGAIVPTPARVGMEAMAEQSRSRPAPGTQKRGFKLFRKSLGQQRDPKTEFV